MSTPTDARSRPSEDEGPSSLDRRPDGADRPGEPGRPAGDGRAHVLDNPAYWSLTGAHAHLAERHGGVLRYQTDVSPFLGLPDPLAPGHWDDLLALVGPGGLVPLTRLPD